MTDRRSGRIRFKKKVTLTPIARWDVVPYQRIEQDATLNIGVVAFSKPGINYVKFTFTDGTNTHSYISRAMTLNSDSGVWEYWATLRAEDYIAGTVTCNATVWGMDGGYRVLEDLPLRVDSDGSLVQFTAYVNRIDATPYPGSDSTGKVDDPTLPYATVGAAITALNTANGGKVDGCLVKLGAGEHYNQHTTNTRPCTVEWLTITGKDGETVNTVSLLSHDSYPQIPMVRYKGIKLQGDAVVRASGTWRPLTTVWIDSCWGYGSGMDQGTNSGPIHEGGEGWGNCYWTGTEVENAQYVAIGAQLCRGLNIHDIGEDVFTRCKCVVSSTVDHSGPLALMPGWTAHSDAWQYNAANVPWENLIIYGLKATNLTYQGMDVDVGGTIKCPCTGVAIVNCLFAMAADSPTPGHYIGQWKRPASHFLIWHCSFISPDGAWNERYWGFKLDYLYASQAVEFDNISISGCVFNWLLSDEDNGGYPVTYTDCTVDEIHTVLEQESVDEDYLQSIGTNTSFGADGLDASFVPLVDSPLRASVRLHGPVPLVPQDLAGNVRSNPTDVGAYEYQPE